ncbi:MAG TPA: hypothetical protein DCO75_05505 [Fibrobacteres bacterium]|nr:hypothetical protein [Fibrobacterota bacterium]
MLANKYHSQIKTYGHILFLPVLLFAFILNAKTAVPVFLLSGQSNMTGYASDSNLTTDQKKNVDNVKIYMDLVWEGDASKKLTWLTLGTGFGSKANNIGPELFLGRTLSDSFPTTKFAFIKCCSGSTYLGKASDWLPPSSNDGKGGGLYRKMVDTAIVNALKTFNTAFDTAQYTPKWAGFVWLQGEFDANDTTYANPYEKNLTNLINDLRAQLKVDDLPVIIPMIDVQNQWKYNSIVRAADVKVAQTLENVDTLDTKGYATDGTHYTGQGQVKIGTVSAQRWLAMKYNYGQAVPVAYRYSQKSIQQQASFTNSSSGLLFDVSGRRMVKMNGQTENMPFGIFITNRNQADAQYKVILNGIKTR